ncbi:hypothetical protein [Nisaea sediminum]|uniref:hypothetical protein n=1 Tax=Nisaea sediminum TaxID=2775867 RepID=UPI001867F341|nr:hypothetical protein [Nisaea sediminum]
MSISGTLIFPTTISPEGPVASFRAETRAEERQPVGNERFTAPRDQETPSPSDQRIPQASPQPIVNPANLSQAQETGTPSQPAAGPVQQAEAGTDGEPPRAFADPTRLREVQQGEGGESDEIRLGLQGEEKSTDIAARLVPVSGVESADSVALDGRPDSVRVGDLISDDQRLTGDPLEVPNYAIDPDERSLQIFNERLTRTTEVLQFLSSRPNVGTARGVSIIV